MLPVRDLYKQLYTDTFWTTQCKKLVPGTLEVAGAPPVAISM